MFILYYQIKNVCFMFFLRWVRVPHGNAPNLNLNLIHHRVHIAQNCCPVFAITFFVSTQGTSRQMCQHKHYPHYSIIVGPSSAFSFYQEYLLHNPYLQNIHGRSCFTIMFQQSNAECAPRSCFFYMYLYQSSFLYFLRKELVNIDFFFCFYILALLYN